METSGDPALRDLAWLRELGLTQQDTLALNPCVPGEFTTPDAYYINSATPRIVYRGSNEGTLPLVTGRWYLIPSGVVDRNPNLSRDPVPVARAPRLIR